MKRRGSAVEFGGRRKGGRLVRRRRYTTAGQALVMAVVGLMARVWVVVLMLEMFAVDVSGFGLKMKEEKKLFDVWI